MISGAPISTQPTLKIAAESFQTPHKVVTLEQLLATARRRVWTILTVGLIGASLGGFVGLYSTPRYTATATLLVEPKQTGLLDAIRQERRLAPDPELIETQIQLLTSRSHLSGVVNELSLFDDPELMPEIVERKGKLILKLPGWLEWVASLVPESWLIQTGLAERGLTREQLETPAAVREAAIGRFMMNVDAWQTGESFIINVAYTSLEPQKAAWLATEVAQSFVKWQLANKRGGLGQTSGWLEARVSALQDLVRTSEKNVAEFRASHGLASTSYATFADQSIADLYQQLIAIRSEQIALNAKLDRILSARRDGGSQGGVLALAEELNSAVIVDLRGQEAALLQEQAALSETYGDRHPKMVNLRAALGEIQAKIEFEIERGIRSLQDQLVVLEGRERTINAEMEKLRGESQTDRLAEVQLAELEREAQTNRDAYMEALAQYRAAEEQGQAVVPDVSVVSEAVPPVEPSNPGPVVLGLLGGTSSLILGALLAFAMERVDRRVRSIDDLETNLGVRVLGIMPKVDKGTVEKADVFVVDNPLSAFSECALSVLATLDFIEKGGTSCPVILVTSALPEEAKTTLVLSLAATAARSGKVLIMDLDLRRPSIERRISGRTSRIGLVDYLNGDLSREQLVQHSARSDVDFIPVGLVPDNPTELLRSHKLRQLLNSLVREYDRIFIDCSPLLAVADAKVATRLADRVVVPVRWQRTEITAVEHALRVLDEAEAVLLGCVLSVVDMDKYKLYGNDRGKYYDFYKKYYHTGNSRKRKSGKKFWTWRPQRN